MTEEKPKVDEAMSPQIAKQVLAAVKAQVDQEIENLQKENKAALVTAQNDAAEDYDDSSLFRP